MSSPAQRANHTRGGWFVSGWSAALRLFLPFALLALLFSLIDSDPAGATAIKKPSAPTGVNVLGLNQDVVISWTAPAKDGGSLITGYTAEVKAISGSHRQTYFCSTAGATVCAQLHLTDGTRYSVTVRASNAVGLGKKSKHVGAVPRDEADCSYIGVGADLDSCDLSGSDLSGVDLSDASLGQTDLSDSNLMDVNFSGANVFFTQLSGADLSDADLSQADLYYAQGPIVGTPAGLPSGWGLFNGYLIGPQSDAENADLTGVDLSGFDVFDSSFFNSDLTDANLTGTNFNGSSLSQANLTGANLTNAILTAADLSLATLTDVTWSNTTCPDGTNSDDDGGTCVNNLSEA
jgi:uncharacterized protein YjbI with pentapeptide repeats